ncbi:response regulator transcription factor [Demequina sp. TTPB684]|uniref:response regulator transcription factor n=1 Tax=unclassified Demequina TaxID=2620311 RepID=UPI001CF26F0B|nr:MULTISPECIES: response regulator transcription factor [unclassified Demequina]MCB2411938.1 response regulator transcription factor [Demequina sp. TTPB684]UPU88061.1 response regulator transcription factor [Demequina sp. TMPB413]
MNKRRILVIDDEDNLRTMLVAALKFEGYQVAQAPEGRTGLRAAKELRPDLIVLDVMMPELDGFGMLKRLRESGDRTPVIFLTAKDTTADAVAGLGLGADDYLAKPFALEELVARVESVMRRVDASATASSVMTLADLTLDDVAHEVTRNGREIHLSPTEYKLLAFLMANTGRVMSRGQLLTNVWGYSPEDDPSVVETYIGYVRKKVDCSEPKLIHTVRGVGYTMKVAQ